MISFINGVSRVACFQIIMKRTSILESDSGLNPGFEYNDNNNITYSAITMH